jgi:hypothetical protein
MDTFAELQNYPDVIISGTNSLVPRLCSPSWGGGRREKRRWWRKERRRREDERGRREGKGREG